MRPPSVELLRALHSAACPLTQSRSCQTFSRCFTVTTSRLPKSPSYTSSRELSTSRSRRDASYKSRAPATHDRGPASTEDTQTDFGKMDIFNSANVNAPTTSIDACTTDGFHLNNGVKTTGGSGILVLGGESFRWRPWGTSGTIGNLLNAKTGVLSVPLQSFSVLSLLYPKPDLLIIGTGSKLWMLSKESREYLGSLGIRVDVMDTGNASAAYNLLATERGVDGVGGAFLPVGWRGPQVGKKRR